jgi:hypothetical protein
MREGLSSAPIIERPQRLKAMKLLLDDRYAPLTTSLGFIHAPLEEVAASLHEWRQSTLDADFGTLLQRELKNPGTIILSGRPFDRELSTSARQRRQVRYLTEQLYEPFPEILTRLEPLTLMGQERELLLQTDSLWTVYLDNGVKLLERIAPTMELCRILKCRGLVVVCKPHTVNRRNATGRHGSVQFQLFAQEQTDFLNYLRTIYATHDGDRWVFGAHGTPQPFEIPERYLAPRVKDRFTSEMLEAYCAGVGVRYFDPSFYKPRGTLIYLDRPLRGLTLAEAQRRLGIHPHYKE